MTSSLVHPPTAPKRQGERCVFPAAGTGPLWLAIPSPANLEQRGCCGYVWARAGMGHISLTKRVRNGLIGRHAAAGHSLVLQAVRGLANVSNYTSIRRSIPLDPADY